MLPVAHRMRLRRDFDAAVRLGRRSGRQTLVVHVLMTGQNMTGQNPGPARVGLIVSRRVGSAVVRNRVKRRLREAARGCLPSLPDGAVVVLRANPAAATATFGELCADLDSALGRALRATRAAASLPGEVRA